MKLILAALAITSLLVLSGCKMLEVATQAGTAVGVATGTISTDQASSINKGAAAAGKAFEKLTPEQEYYIGRSVAATILSSYTPYDNNAANQYLNTLGQALAMASDKPETFGGYHFLVMDTDEVNAFAAPGGLILISRGMLRCCKNEDEVAAVLAHEIAHVQLEHGLQSIEKSRWTSAFTIIGAETLKNVGSQQIAQLTTILEGAVGDIASTLVDSGYSRKYEAEADATAIVILERIGYPPVGLRNMLMEMDKRLAHDDRGFAKTHPAPADRVADIDKQLGAATEIAPQKQRAARFKEALGKI